MTDVRSDDFTVINSIDDVIPFYAGNKLPDSRQYIGFETEIAFYKKGDDNKPVAASAKDCADVLQYLKKLGHQPQLEMASAVEYASPAFRVTEVAQLNREITESFKAYTDAIRDKGFTPNDQSLFPFATLQTAEDNLVDRDRARGLVKGMKLFKEPEFLKVTLLCTSTQVSLSYKDPNDLHDLLSTGYALSAPIYALFANHPAYVEGSDKRLDVNPRAAFYEAFGKQGGVPETFLQAKDGDDFIRRHAQQVFETELLFYYDRDKNLVWPEKPVKFEELKSLGLNTRSNYDLAESFIYTDLKVCNIRDDEGRPTGKRIEVRGLDAGQLGAEASVPFIHATLRDPQARLETKALLAEYGLSPDQDGWQERTVAARRNAAHHGGNYLNVAFGVKPDGTVGTLREFSQELGNILERYAARNPGIADAIAPLTEICRTGVSLAQAKAAVTKNYEHANQLLLGINDNNKPLPAPAAARKLG